MKTYGATDNLEDTLDFHLRACTGFFSTGVKRRRKITSCISKLYLLQYPAGTICR
jgi:hypothetical protein